MASLAKAVKNKTRRKLIAQFADKRLELKRVIRSPKSTTEDVAAAQKKLRAMPRDSSKTRYRNRCKVTGRPRAYLRKFGMSRIAFRELSLAGEVPGVIKSSW